MPLYNQGYPANYQPIYQPVQYQPVQYQPMQQPQQQPMQQSQAQATQGNPMSSSIIWVSGEAGAKAYLVAPNTTVQLWNSEAQQIFLKSADASGMPSIKILDYTIRDSAPQNAVNAAISQSPQHPIEYAGKAEQDALRAEIAAYRSDMDAIRSEIETVKSDLYGIAGKKPSTRKKEADDE